jgi:hypothetical protein
MQVMCCAWVSFPRAHARPMCGHVAEAKTHVVHVTAAPSAIMHGQKATTNSCSAMLCEKCLDGIARTVMTC